MSTKWVQFLLSGIMNLKYEIIFQVETERVSFFSSVFLNNIVCDSVLWFCASKRKKNGGKKKHTWKQRCPKPFYFIMGIASSISLSLSGNFRESSDISSITAGIPELGLHFYTAKEFPSSLQFFFCRRVKTVPSLEEPYPRQREASLGRDQWKQDKEGGHKSERGWSLGEQNVQRDQSCGMACDPDQY